MLSIVDTKLALKEEVAILEKKANPKSDNLDQKSDKNKGGQPNNESKSKPNPCKTHDGAHDWKNCPDNPYNKNKIKGESNGTKGESEGKTKGKKELHSTQSTNESTKKTPVVRTNKEPEVKVIDNRYSDLNYSSDEASAMMVHAPKRSIKWNHPHPSAYQRWLSFCNDRLN